MGNKRINRNMLRMIATTLTLILFFANCTTAFATDEIEQTVGDTGTVYDDSNLSSTSITPRSDAGWYYKEVKVDSKTAYKKPIGYAGGQRQNGVVFTDPDDGFYWSNGGYNVSVSISVGYGPMSVSVSRGGIGSIGYFKRAGIANKAVKLYIYRDLTTTRYKRYKVYYSGAQQYIGYVYKTVPTKDYLTIRTAPF